MKTQKRISETAQNYWEGNMENLTHDAIYDVLDKLYRRGWYDSHKGKDYDPRGTEEWQNVCDIIMRITETAKQMSTMTDTREIKNESFSGM